MIVKSKVAKRFFAERKRFTAMVKPMAYGRQQSPFQRCDQSWYAAC